MFRNHFFRTRDSWPKSQMPRCFFLGGIKLDTKVIPGSFQTMQNDSPLGVADEYIPYLKSCLFFPTNSLNCSNLWNLPGYYCKFEGLIGPKKKRRVHEVWLWVNSWWPLWGWIGPSSLLSSQPTLLLGRVGIAIRWRVMSWRVFCFNMLLLTGFVKIP